MHRCEACGQKCFCDGDYRDWYAAPVDCKCDHGCYDEDGESEECCGEKS